MEEKEQDILVQRYETEKTEVIEAIKRLANEDEEKHGELSWKSVLGGDILQSKLLMRQVIFVIFVVLLMLIYTGNRYAGQQEAILIDSLQIRLQTEKYNVLTQSSELLNKSRQSLIEEQLIRNGDTALVSQITPTYIIKNDVEE
ncbi:MAG: hypothetical protein KBT06_10705 [Prevotellaceae bacterium]|nr:hypothetical protein [Candidatus Colivivens equi]MCQ2075432.1 hypothetical protein [Bacteroidaceae bacterium]